MWPSIRIVTWPGLHHDPILKIVVSHNKRESLKHYIAKPYGLISGWIYKPDYNMNQSLRLLYHTKMVVRPKHHKTWPCDLTHTMIDCFHRCVRTCLWPSLLNIMRLHDNIVNLNIKWQCDSDIEKGLGDTITMDNNENELVHWFHHLIEGLKDQYITMENPLDFGYALQHRNYHQKTVLLPKARND